MIKAKLHFTLVGRTDLWRKYSKDMRVEFTNTDNLDYVRGIISEHFGDRAMIIMNEKTLTNEHAKYPRYFSAGWMVSEGDNQAELVVVAHADTMAAANKAMLDSVIMIDWDNLAVRI